MANTKRILILSASIGTGHVRAAQALERALRDNLEGFEIRHEDALDFANATFRKLYQQSYVKLVNEAPHLLGFLFNYGDKTWTTEEHGLAIERWNSAGLIGFVKDFQPDVVVSTHPLPADMISWLHCKGRLSTQHAVIITDFDIHPLWLCHHYSRYFVAIEEIREHMAQLGYHRQRIQVTGIPVDPVFAEIKNKTEMRLKHGLAVDKTTLLLSVGGLGMGPLEEVLSALKHLQSRVQIVAVCGNNAELKGRAETIATEVSSFSGNPIKCIGYTNDMDELMTAADLIVGKAGGLTSSEALCKGIVFVIANPVPGQEERNADHLLEEWVAIRCNNLPALAYKIDQLLEDREKLELMRAKSLAFGKPNAAQTIAREVAELALEEQPILALHPANHHCEAVPKPKSSGIIEVIGNNLFNNHKHDVN